MGRGTFTVGEPCSPATRAAPARCQTGLDDLSGISETTPPPPSIHAARVWRPAQQGPARLAAGPGVDIKSELSEVPFDPLGGRSSA